MLTRVEKERRASAKERHPELTLIHYIGRPMTGKEAGQQKRQAVNLLCDESTHPPLQSKEQHLHP